MKKTVGVIMIACVILIWGVTFVSTRALLQDFSSLEILILRFVLAFVVLCVLEKFNNNKESSTSWCSEWIFVLMAFTGVVAYQFLENCAIYYTSASNVAILVSFGPIVTALMTKTFNKTYKLSIRLIIGSLIAITGVSAVSLNGLLEFEFRPLGDVMALCAMFSWGGYSILIDKVNDCKIPAIVAIRKSFGWSLVLMLPFAVWGATYSGLCALDGSFAIILDRDINVERFSKISNWMNLCFLGFLASAVSFVLWNVVCSKLGVVKTTVSLYLTPIVGIAFAAIFLGERVTLPCLIGTSIILIGVAIAIKEKE